MNHEEPLSWLVLEQYVLGELSEAQIADVERRLVLSSEDRARLQQIKSERAELLELKPPDKDSG